MIVKEYGEDNKDIIVLLHGGGLSWWNFEDVAELLNGDYHIFLPILNGHSGSDKDFTNIEKNADEIIEYIDNNFSGHVKLIGGLSLGGQILLDILKKRDNICEFAIIESTLMYPMKITSILISPTIRLSYNLISKKWFSKLQFNNLKIKKSLFDRYYNETSKISLNNMIDILKASLNYNNKELNNIKTKSLIIVGGKERPIMKKSAKRIHNELINSKLKIINGYHHGDLSINHAYEYSLIIKDFIK